MNSYIENILRFVIVFLLQVLLFNNLQFLGICHPCIYLLFLFALPVQLPRWAELLIGFATGLLMDLFCNTLGMHTAACVLVAYLRPLFIHNMVAESERIIGSMNGATIGRNIYLRIVVILTFVHHITLFSLTAWNVADWWITLLEIILSALLTLTLIITYDLLKP